MYSIDSKNNITLTRGDSLYLTIEIIEDGSTYTPESGDTIRFAMKKSYFDDDVVLEKTIDNNTLVLYIAPEDTSDLDFGVYVYDIQITKSDGDVGTFLGGLFVVDLEVE